MTFLKTVKLTTLTLLLLLLFTNNSNVNAVWKPKLKTLFNVDLAQCFNWDHDTLSLYFTDMKAIFRFDYNEDKLYYTDIMPSSCMLPIDSSPNLFAVSTKRHLDIVEWDGRSKNYEIKSTLFEFENINPGDEFQFIINMVADKYGRLYIGTGEDYPHGYGCLYFWEKGMKEPSLLFDNVTDPIGMAFDYPNKKFYFIDTITFGIDVFDYDENTGGISNRKNLYDFKHDSTYSGFYPNGVIVDTNGLLLVPALRDYKILFVDPVNKTIVRAYETGCKYIWSIVFGGPNLNILYVGSSKQYVVEPTCGDVLRVSCLEASGFASGKLKL